MLLHIFSKMYNKTKYIFLKFIEKFNTYIVYYFSELIRAKNSPMKSLTSDQFRRN